MRVLILGGTGLISTAITRQLLERGDEVVLFNRGKSEERFPAGATTIHGDRYQHADFEAKVQAAGEFDAVIDMICYRPEEAESLVRAVKGRAKQVIFCSTVDVYKKPANTFPYTEAEPRESLSDYGRNKVICEDIVHNAGGFESTVIRPAATYGEGGVIIHTFGWRSTFLDRLRRGMPVVVMGDGSALWTMCHVDDEARAFIGAIGNPKAYGKSYHATGEEWFTWNRYHEIICEAMGWPEPNLVHIPTDLMARAFHDRIAITTYNFQYTNIYDNSAAKSDLGFAYTVPFAEGAKRTIDFMVARDRIEAAEAEPEYDEVLAAWAKASDLFAGSFVS